MLNKIEILAQVMLSLKGDQNSVMNDINALLNNSDNEKGLIKSLKKKIRNLSSIHADMQEVEFFIEQTISISEKTIEKVNFVSVKKTEE